MSPRTVPAARAAAALLAATLLGAASPSTAAAHGASTAALQVALKALRYYGGGVDGIAGPRTRAATRRFQRRRGLTADGVAGPRTRRALGRRGRPAFGSRTLRRGARGWDVAALQFLLVRRRAAGGVIDGGFGPATERAVRRFQRRAGLGADGVAGPATRRALRGARSAGLVVRRGASGNLGDGVRFLRPVRAPLGDLFGMRWGRAHTGIDFPAPAGARVTAGGVGVTVAAGYNGGGYGNLVVIRHRLGYQSWYAHLSRITTWPGERVVGGTRIGLVGSTGHSTGPHLHFEVRRNGVPYDPVPRMLGAAASALTARPALAGPRSRPTCARSDAAPPC